MGRVFLHAGLVLGLGALLGTGLLPRGSQQDVDAGTALRLEVEGLVEEAELCLEGHVRGTRVVEPAPGRLETEVELDVDRWFLGDEGPRVTVAMPGGVREDGFGLLLPGMPTLRQGEDVLLFLSEAGATGVRVPVGLSQGKFRVETRLDGQRGLSRAHGSLTTVDPTTGVARDAQGAEIFDYAETVARIHAAVAAKEAR